MFSISQMLQAAGTGAMTLLADRDWIETAFSRFPAIFLRLPRTDFRIESCRLLSLPFLIGSLAIGTTSLALKTAHDQVHDVKSLGCRFILSSCFCGWRKLPVVFVWFPFLLMCIGFSFRFLLVTRCHEVCLTSFILCNRTNSDF